MFSYQQQQQLPTCNIAFADGNMLHSATWTCNMHKEEDKAEAAEAAAAAAAATMESDKQGA